jgi:prepilin-type N-terminal cleavage/methylation domain-containing protein
MILPTKKTGFTLIELLLVVTIISIITVGIIPGFSNYIKNQNLKQAQEQIKSDLRSTQNKSLTGSLSDQLVGGTAMKFWGMKFTNENSEYIYFISTVDTSCPVTLVAPALQGKGKLANGLVIKGLTTSGCLFFSVQDGGITSIGFGSDEERFVSVGYPNPSLDVKKIRFNSTGLIYSKNE